MMYYKKIKCPNCGNKIIAKSLEEPQECVWCNRLFKVKLTKKNNKEGRGAKFSWKTEIVDSE